MSATAGTTPQRHHSLTFPFKSPGNGAAFAKWAKEHSYTEMADYVARPGARVKQIKALAADAGITFEKYAGQRIARLPIMPM